MNILGMKVIRSGKSAQRMQTITMIPATTIACGTTLDNGMPARPVVT